MFVFYRNLSLTMDELLNNYIRGHSSGNSLFTSSFDLSLRSNFLPAVECNYINSDNGMHPLLDQSNFPLINEYNKSLGNGGQNNNIGSQYSNTVSERSYGKHFLLTNFDYYFSCGFFILFFIYMFIYYFII